MEFFEVIRKRRSIRRFQPEPFPDASVRQALEAAVLAPNSSNVQSWDFHWIPPTSKLREPVVRACLSQSAARTASHIVVITADGTLWRRSQSSLIKWVEDVGAPPLVVSYYKKLVPTMYRWGIFSVLAPIKWLVTLIVGFTRPMPRGPYGRRDVQEVAVKSAALAAENFVLAITALGGASCMMEGFDECRLRPLLGLRRTARIVMAIGVGYEAERGTWGPQFRLPSDQVIHRHD